MSAYRLHVCGIYTPSLPVCQNCTVHVRPSQYTLGISYVPGKIRLVLGTEKRQSICHSDRDLVAPREKWLLCGAFRRRDLPAVDFRGCFTAARFR